MTSGSASGRWAAEESDAEAASFLAVELVFILLFFNDLMR